MLLCTNRVAKSPVQQYLARYAEPDSQDYAAVVQDCHHRALVVPVFDEDLANLMAIPQRSGRADVLIIFVVNIPDSAEPSTRQRNLELLSALRASCGAHDLVIDRVNTPLPRRQGVGLARKLGTDVALHLFAQGRLTCPWIYQTDADAVLPHNYFQHPLPSRGTVVFNHCHVATDPSLQRAANLYDAHATRYHQSLTAAGSHYGYPTLGSTMVIHAEDYASVRGYPRRNAGEDFHMLNKLAKVGAVTRIPNVNIELAARESHRVPFGTGPALAKIQSLLETDPSGRTFLSYHSASFELLAQTLSQLNAFAAHPSTAILDDQARELLYELGWLRVVKNLATKYADANRRHKAIHDWFDALRTLRFIHLARRFYPDQPMPDAWLAQALR